VPVQTITLDKTSGTMNVGGRLTVKAAVGPANATDKTLTVVSQDPGIAKVENVVYNNATGETTFDVVGVSNGTRKTSTLSTTITVTSSDTKASAIFTVTVTR
jgi:uncharacterized protein YjdB